jgi:hypothetical protein
MTVHVISRQMMGVMERRRHGNNGKVPSGPIFHRGAHGINLTNVHLQKCYLAAYENMLSVYTPGANSNYYMAYGYVPPQTTNVRAYCGFIASRATRASEANPRAQIRYGTASAADTGSDFIRYSEYSNTDTAATPANIVHGYIDIGVTGGNDHSFVLECWRLRPMYCTIIGYSKDSTANDANDGAVDPTRYGTLSPIRDTDIVSLMAETANTLCWCGTQLITWTRMEDANPATTTSASYTQMSDSDDYYIPNLAYLETRRQTGVRVKLAVNAFTSSGSTNGVEIVDADTSTQQLEVTSFNATSTDETFTGWKTATGTISSGTTKLAIRIKSDGAATFSVNGVSLFMFCDPVGE